MSQVDLATDQDWLEMWWMVDGVTYRLAGRMGDHGPELWSVEMVSDRPLTVGDLRFPIISTFITNFELTHGQIRVRLPRKGRPRDQSSASNRLEEVARIARSAPPQHRGKTVAAWFNVSTGYARQLISSARKAGFEVYR